MAPSGGDVYNVQANGGMAAGESEHIRESHKNTLKTSRIPRRAYSIVLGPRLLNGGGTRNKFLCLRKMYAISILTYYLYLYQTGDRKHNHLWSERGGSRAGGVLRPANMNFHRNLLHSSFMIYWCPCRAASLLCLVVLSSSASSHIIGVNGFTASCLRRHLCPWHVSGDVAGAVSQLSSLCRGAGWFPTPRPPRTQT